jgi:hypothetical protein
MRKALAAVMLLVLGLSWTPLVLAMTAAGAHHRCCHRMQAPSMQLASPPGMCGTGRCCVSSDRTTTLPAVSPAPRHELRASGFVPVAPIEAKADDIAPDVSSPFRSSFDLGMILRI